VKVVIIGQDPYHGADQAHGLSFSVPEWVKIPPSLRNIFKELEKEWFSSPSRNGDRVETSGSLVPWARQWVLLLNSVLTVEAWRPASHSKIWWQNFTDEIIKIISAEKKWVVFLLWWAFAIWKQELIDSEKHLILTSPHPSPFSAYKWFFWNMHFLETNKYLKQLWKSEIKW
jgi:uracil-DNA glycosylase